MPHPYLPTLPISSRIHQARVEIWGYIHCGCINVCIIEVMHTKVVKIADGNVCASFK